MKQESTYKYAQMGKKISGYPKFGNRFTLELRFN